MTMQASARFSSSRSLRSFLLVTALLAGACKVPKGVDAAPRYSARQQRPATQVEAVRELTSLPPGIAFIGDAIQLAKDFPTAEEPHQVLGVYDFPFDRHDDNQAAVANQAVRAQLRAKAPQLVAQQGGNGYVIAGSQLWVIHVSAATPAAHFYPSAQQALEKAHAKPSGATLVTKATRTLNAWTSVPVSFEKGSCYHVSVALAPDASLDRKLWGRAITTLELQPVAKKGPRAATGFKIEASAPGLAQRAYGVAIGCAGNNLSGQLDWKFTGGALGVGEVEIALWKKTPRREAVKIACTACASTDARTMDACLAREQLSSAVCSF